ncbi:site-2 protease family protein [Thalassococcus sp. CAU 1522]|uniref:Zinc metalloprotease n=1 Tax=Thalassococcus arenae TaxID=2851652 RepID=A0ABS6N9Y2_9RHOB|nr:site-2 protease family protein [Thalassococcus arenae]MBV2360831.1 site-2 protease family protein [Thalassococcus arenae]
MSWSFPIGRLLGSELRVHATFFLLLAWVAFSAYGSGGSQAALANTAFILVLFACVVAHEYGHALMARRFGIRTPDITLLPIGGLARLERMPEKPGQELAVALAGPAVNVVIWAALVVIVGVPTDVRSLADFSAGPAEFLGRVAAVNLFLAVFNLIPAFPMDGGRVLRAVLSIFTGRVRATRIAATAGQIVALLFGFWGASSGNIVLILIAVFVFLAAQAEAADVQNRAIAHGLSARDAVITSFEPLSPDDTLAMAGQALIRTTQHEFPVLAADGRLAGFLTRSALLRGMAEGAATRPVSDMMETDVPVLPLSAPLEQVLDALAQAPAVAVTDRFGALAGYITRENIGELMVLRQPR